MVENLLEATFFLMERIYRLLGRIPLTHSPLAHSPGGGVFNRSTNFDAGKIREEGFEQPVSNENALRTTVEWHLQHEYDEALPGRL